MTYAHAIAVPQPGLKPQRSAQETRGAGHSVSGVTQAIARASARTGVDFSYLLDKASVESSLNPTAHAKNSSATGLYQFIEKTWLQMVRDYGDKYGLSDYARCIDENCQVSNARMRQEILNLRNDPETSACMAAEYANQNAGILKQQVGDITDIGNTELYLAHFLGPSGATKFLEKMHANPNARGANVFPAEAQSNPGVFYDRSTGRARSLQQIYAYFDSKFNDATAEKTAQVAVNMMPTSFGSDASLTASQDNTWGQSSFDASATDATSNEDAPTEDSLARLIAMNTAPQDDMLDLPSTVVDALLAAAPKSFARVDDEDSGRRSTRVARNAARTSDRDTQTAALSAAPSASRASVPTAVTMPAATLAALRADNTRTTSTAISSPLPQAALMVLAQGFAHDDQGRYNS